ncbi:chemotaxis protein CheA [Candidatus Formimonas warabiya]|uniref:Chemotaxis protein CheA n=1 Tax=Formimonas warabiya TaxID=1761012 RepID=A0A3G1KUI2_FORW1|nr:chemotaxis protein CheA [Candidatus Formimonas warabiya]ATW26101.1 chemotaxis protein CheA [Candidatus Formimonas warabiya]
MSDHLNREPMVDLFIFETTQLLEKLEQVILNGEKSGGFTQPVINEIFRIMHTIKGSSAMMLFQNISTLAHAVEDLFFFIREEKPENVNYSELLDLVFEGVDFFRGEMERIKNGDQADGEPGPLMGKIKGFLVVLKQHNLSPVREAGAEEKEDLPQKYYITQNKIPVPASKNAFEAVIFFEEGCEMESLRAYAFIHDLKERAADVYHLPGNLIDDDDSSRVIQEEGFRVLFITEQTYAAMHDFFMQIPFLQKLELIQLENDEKFKQLSQRRQVESDEACGEDGQLRNKGDQGEKGPQTNYQSMIPVHVAKLDKLMDLVGELVISEAMVTQNPDLKGLELDNFHKAARQLQKITGELQDVVMSIRMVPLATIFQKMIRVVRDMSKKLDKEVELAIIGEETEVDKNIIEHIADPLMHLIRNSLDHGIEPPLERQSKGKVEPAKITLEAKNAGGDVLILIKDNGRGLNKEKILARARENGLLHKPEGEFSDREIYHLIFLPGFSTKETVTEFSGRGVGMDVVARNIETVGGSVAVESREGEGTAIMLKIPLTLAIIDGMNIRVGSARYTIPITAIKESFRPQERDIITDPEGNEMMMVRGQCLPILRLHELYRVKAEAASFTDGIMILVEQDEKNLCIFADQLLGQQQVVVKALPGYIRNFKKIHGLAGCTLLGDGSISLILDIGGLIPEAGKAGNL